MQVAKPGPRCPRDLDSFARRAFSSCPFCCTRPVRDQEFCDRARVDCDGCNVGAILTVLRCGGGLDGRGTLPSYSEAGRNDYVFKYDFCPDCCLGLVVPR